VDVDSVFVTCGIVVTSGALPNRTVWVQRSGARLLLPDGRGPAGDLEARHETRGRPAAVRQRPGGQARREPASKSAGTPGSGAASASALIPRGGAGERVSGPPAGGAGPPGARIVVASAVGRVPALQIREGLSLAAVGRRRLARERGHTPACPATEPRRSGPILRGTSRSGNAREEACTSGARLSEDRIVERARLPGAAAEEGRRGGRAAPERGLPERGESGLSRRAAARPTERRV
jgi:hypothetical protein